ncbi:MAG: U32 family peptidase [Desulfobacter sp.]|nr:MAG: U32 family peptidase [Desulfobacter sp.]
MENRVLELLAPAKNLELGRAAVDHGADAVYIGADRFGARASAGNSLKDIEALCTHAHRFRARVYVALNTLVFDDELEAAAGLVRRVWNAGADALIVQDMGLLEMDLPPIPLFASTQADNRTPEKVKFLEDSGFERVILTRELGLDAITEIRKQTKVALETFVHGALCVSYSGQCYMSAAIGGRSANRGACGQPCRLPWNLVSESGQVVEKNRYLLSLKDMNRADHLAALAHAGISSFKIEGRLKDLSYVKNITGFYRQRLDKLLEGETQYKRASSGRTRYFFTPDPAKTFNRGQTDYFLSGDRTPIHSFDTPKSMGERMGKVKECTPNWIKLDRAHDLRNGDGICFLDGRRKLSGFYINRLEKDGRIFLPSGPGRQKNVPSRGTWIYRNHDQAFANAMAGKTAERKIGVDFIFSECPSGFFLEAVDEDGTRARAALEISKEAAKNPDRAVEIIEKQLGKLGNTLFYLRGLDIRSAPYFLPAKALNGLRRDVVSALEKARLERYRQKKAKDRPSPVPCYKVDLDFRANVANGLARRFYEKRGARILEPAFELSPPDSEVPVMATKHCIRYSLGRCPKQKGSGEKKAGPLYLENEKGRFRLVFNCRACEMEIRTIQD